MSESNQSAQRNYAMFDAELSGAVLNMHMLGRIWRWLNPYKLRLLLSAVLILITSFFAVIMEIIISRVLVDYVIIGEADSNMPDLGMIELTKWVTTQLSIEPIYSAGILFSVSC